MSQNVIPVIVVIDPSNPVAGATVSVNVAMNDAPDKEQAVTISSSPAGAFSSIPASVTVVAPSNQVTFQATLSESAWGPVSVTATCNGGTATGSCLAAAEPGG